MSVLLVWEGERMSFRPMGVSEYGCGPIGENLDPRPPRTQKEILQSLAARAVLPQIIKDMEQEVVREAEALLDRPGTESEAEHA